MDLNALECDYRINVVGPARAYQAYLPLIAKSTKKTVINVFSSQGIVGRHGRASCTTTSITKAALKVLVSSSVRYVHSLFAKKSFAYFRMIDTQRICGVSTLDCRLDDPRTS